MFDFTVKKYILEKFCLSLLYHVTARSSNKIKRNWVVTQFCVILLDDLAMT